MLLYDADCRVCRFVARGLVRLDRDEQLALLPLQDPAAAPLLAALPAEERLASWRLAEMDGSLTGHGAGLPRLLLTMRRTHWLGRWLGAIPPGALDAAYRIIARSRGRLGRVAPAGPAPRRFP